MNNSSEECVGYIEIQFIDEKNDQVVCLGGAGFLTAGEDNAAWNNVPASTEETMFVADRLNAESVIVDNKSVSTQTCEQLMGRPISELIAEGRKRLEEQLSNTQSR